MPAGGSGRARADLAMPDEEVSRRGSNARAPWTAINACVHPLRIQLPRLSSRRVCLPVLSLPLRAGRPSCVAGPREHQPGHRTGVPVRRQRRASAAPPPLRAAHRTAPRARQRCMDRSCLAGTSVQILAGGGGPTADGGSSRRALSHTRAGRARERPSRPVSPRLILWALPSCSEQ